MMDEADSEQEAESEKRSSENQMPDVASTAQRHVSFKGENIELKVSQAHSQSTAIAEETGEGAVMRGRARSELARTDIQRFTVTRERKWSVSIASLVAAIPALLMGLTLAYPSNAILDLRGEATELPQEFFFSDLTQSLFVALSPLGAVFSGPVAGWIADRWGRKCCMMFCGVPYLIGYLLLSYAHYASTVTGFNALLLTGRFFAGLGMGWSTAICPVYTAELCSSKLRGLYGNMFPFFISTGVLFSLALGAIRDFRYYSISLVAVGIVALYEVLMLWLPETPRWLLARGRVKQAESVLLWLRGKKVDVEKELKDMKKALSERKPKAWKLFLKRSVLIPFSYVLILFIMQQAGGINAITPFAGILLTNAGVGNPREATIYSVGVTGVVAMIVSFALIDYSGRKFLLIISGLGQFIATALLGTHAFITRPALCFNSSDDTVDTVCNPQYKYMALFSIIFFTTTFAVGYNAVPFVLLAELLPLPVRGLASGIVTATLWITAALFSGFYFEFTELVTPWFALWIIAALSVSVVIFVIIIIPETKGKHFEELENLFVKRPDIVETVL